MINMLNIKTEPLRAKEYILPNTPLGLAYFGHRVLGQLPTVIGYTLSHSDKPNCMLVVQDTDKVLWSIKEIFIDEELTIDKRLYE